MPSRGSLVYSGRHALPLCPEPVKMSRNPEKRYWYEVVAEMLAAEGVPDCFALLGDANMHMATHLDSLGTRMIHVRHEHCAVAAAMGYARKTARTAAGRAVISCVSPGPQVTVATPVRPVLRAYPMAAATAQCSCLTWIIRVPSESRCVAMCILASPSSAKQSDTPSAASMSAITSYQYLFAGSRLIFTVSGHNSYNGLQG